MQADSGPKGGGGRGAMDRTAAGLPEPHLPTAAAPTAPSRRYRRYALGLLTAVYVSNYVDRQILSILLESIKHEFSVSDT